MAFSYTSVTKKSVQYVAQFLVQEDLYCACARFCYSVSPWVTFQKFWNNKWIKICVYCYSNIFILGRRISRRKQKFRQLLSSMCTGSVRRVFLCWSPLLASRLWWQHSVPGPSAQYANAVTDGGDVFICKDKCHRALIKRVTHSQARTQQHFS